MYRFIAATIIAGFLTSLPGSVRALDIPVTPCDHVPVMAGASLPPGLTREDGTKAFKYGSGDLPFVSQSGAITTFNFELLFASREENAVQVYFMDANCNMSGGALFMHAFPEVNTVSYDGAAETITVNHALLVQAGLIGPVRYMWLQVFDNIVRPVAATFSYAVDLENIQNPTEAPSAEEGDGSEEEEESAGSGSSDPTDTSDQTESDDSAASSNEDESRLTPDPVIIIPGILGSQDKNGVWLMDPILHTYTDLIETFRANGYVENYDLFPFPYDWRNSNIETAAYLRWRITEAKNLCQCDKVDIVAHSMGGLVARQYIQSSQYGDDVDQLIFLGTPHLGAPKAYMIWAAGEVGGSVADWALEFMLTREGKKQGYPDLLSYVRAKIPSVKQLLPIFDYLTNTDELPANEFLESLDQNLGNLYDSQTDIINIVGELEGDSTIRYITADSLSIEKGVGDGTVPKISGEHVDQNLKTFWAVGHSQLPVETASEVFNILTGHNPATVSEKFRFPDVKLLIFKLLSPADMLITAPDGKRVGKDFETNQEVNEIDGAFYSGFLTDDEYVTILNPVAGNYQITTQGTGSGEYTVATAYITNDGMTEEELISNTEPGQVETLNLAVGNILPRSDLGSGSSVSSGGGGGGGHVAPKETSSGEVLGVSINTIRDGTLVLDSTDGRTVYMIGDGKKHGFVSAEVFLGMGFRFEQVVLDDLSGYESGEIISSISQMHPPGSLVLEEETIWLISGGKRLGFTDLDKFYSAGFSLVQVVVINEADLQMESRVF